MSTAVVGGTEFAIFFRSGTGALVGTSAGGLRSGRCTARNELLTLPKQNDSGKQSHVLELYDTYNIPLYKYLRTLGLVKDDAEDVIQETFLRLAYHLNEGAEDTNLRSWLFQVAHNLSMDQYRGRRREKTVSEEDQMLVPEPAAGPSTDPEQIYLYNETIERVRVALEQLTPQQKNGVLLRSQGLRYAEIAAVLGVSESRAIHLVKRALIRITGGL